MSYYKTRGYKNNRRQQKNNLQTRGIEYPFISIFIIFYREYRYILCDYNKNICENYKSKNQALPTVNVIIFHQNIKLILLYRALRDRTQTRTLEWI